MKKYCLFLIVIALNACTTVRYPNAQIDSKGMATNTQASQEDLKKVQTLRTAITNMGAIVSNQEAQRIAHMAVYYPQVLTNKYELTSPPLLHNVLVNTGHKSRGLCINWTEDMINQTLKINPKTLDIYWGVANKGSALREHSTLVIAAKQQPFATGILLDPWRHSGNLFWSKVTEDPKYKWKNINHKDYNRNR